MLILWSVISYDNNLFYETFKTNETYIFKK